MIKDHNLELISYVPSFNFLDEEKESTNVLETDIYELFKKFYSLKFGEETIAPELVQAFKDLVDEVQHEDS